MKIGLVVPTLNGMRYLPQAVDSILTQRGNFDIEVLVVDGGSHDGSCDYLSQVGDSRLRFVTGRDGGQSEAINRGMAGLSSDIVGWLNHDDLLRPLALQTVADAFKRDGGAQWVVGTADMIDENGDPCRTWITRYKNHLLRHYNYRRLLQENFISQMSVFWKKSFGQSLSRHNQLLDCRLRYAMDYDLWLRMGNLSNPYVLPECLAAFRIHGNSITYANRVAQFREQYRVAAPFLNGDYVGKVLHISKSVSFVFVLKLLHWMESALPRAGR